MNQLNYITPKRTFKHLNETKRIQIETLKNQGYSITKIARIIGVHKSTVSREISKGTIEILNSDLTTKVVYEHKAAQNLANKRKRNSRKKAKYIGHEDILREIENLVIRKKYTFEIISGRFKYEGRPVNFSHQTLYNYFHKGILKVKKHHLPNLVASGTHKRTRRENRSHKSINLRPESINNRQEPMHWEMDTVVGSKNQGHSLLVLSERKARYELIFKIEKKNTQAVEHVIDKLHKTFGDDFSRFFKSFTTDNGSEFMDYESIEKNNRTTLYYANPYSSWQRGTNEVLNKEIRRFFPKKTSFNNVSNRAVKKVESWMNNKPRKVLGYQTPSEYMQKIDPKFEEYILKMNA